MSTIQIKRSINTAVPGSLSNGEMAYTTNGGILYIGDIATQTVTPIAGVRNPGTLTANQALVANSTSAINQVSVANLVLVGTQGSIYANGSTGSSGFVLFSGGPGSNSYWASTGALSVNVAAQYVWSNTQTFQNTITFGSIIDVGSVANQVYVNTTTISIGNGTVNSTINSTIFTGTSNNASYLGGTISTSFQLNSTLAANVATMVANNSSYLGGVLAASYVQNTDTRTLSGNLTFTGANLTVTGTNTYISSNTLLSGTNTVISSNLSVTGGLITATSSNLNIQNIAVSGNLIVSGSLVSINASHLVVNDNFIEIGDNNLTTDAVDTGFFSPGGNSTLTWYSGFARIASLSTNNNPVYWLFSSNTNPNTSLTIDTSANTTTGTLKSYLTPWGPGGVFVVNSSGVTITGNSTVGVTVNANTLTTSTALAASSGGTGLGTVTQNAILVGNTGSVYTALTLGGSGTILQSTGSALVYAGLDGGTF